MLNSHQCFFFLKFIRTTAESFSSLCQTNWSKVERGCRVEIVRKNCWAIYVNISRKGERKLGVGGQRKNGSTSSFF